MAESMPDAIDLAELQRRAAHRTEADMDMTPMVDVTFLLLIFFTVTAAFAIQKSLEVPPVDQDQARQPQQVEDLVKDSVVVRVDGDNIFWIGCPRWSEEQRAPSMTDLRAKVREARRGEDGEPGPSRMLVQANGDATHEHVVAALDSGSAVGMEDIRLMTYEDGDL